MIKTKTMEENKPIALDLHTQETQGVYINKKDIQKSLTLWQVNDDGENMEKCEFHHYNVKHPTKDEYIQGDLHLVIPTKSHVQALNVTNAIKKFKKIHNIEVKSYNR